MRIVLASIVDISEPTGPTEHVVGLAKGLEEIGHEVTLVSPVAADLSELGLEDVRAVPSQPGAIARALAVRRAVKQVVEERPDAVYLRAFPYDWHVVARALVVQGIPYFREINSLQFENYRALDIRRPLALERRSEVLSLRHAGGWVPVTEELGVHARDLAGVERPTAIAINGYDPAETRLGRGRDVVRAELGAGTESRVLIMAGVSMPWHGLDLALAAMHRLAHHYRLWLVGPRDADQRSEIEERAIALDGRVSVIDRVGPIGVTELIRAADIGLGPLALSRKALTEAQPLKIGRYLGLGKPVVYNYSDPRIDHLDIEGIVRFAGETPAAVAAAIEKAANAPTESELLRSVARGSLTWAAAAQRTVELIERQLG